MTNEMNTARPVGDKALRGPTERQLHAAMDAFYPGEDWRGDLGCALETSLRDMRAAIVAANRMAPESHPTTGQETVATPRDGGVREALRPFAREADRITPLGSEVEDSTADNVQVWQSGSFEITRSRITYGDLRRARAVLSAPGSAGPGAHRLAVAPARLEVSANDELWDAIHEAMVCAWNLLDGTADDASGVCQEDWDALAMAMETMRNLVPETEEPFSPSYAVPYLRAAYATPSPAQEPGTGDRGDAELRREVALFVSCVKALMRHTNPTNVNEGHAQQWFAVSDAIRMKIEPLLGTTPATTAETRGPAEGAR